MTPITKTVIEVRGKVSGKRLFDLCLETCEIFIKRGDVLEVVDLKEYLPQLQDQS